MAVTIVVGNFKGGVGKTKVSVMASWELVFKHNKKVLLVDLDPQGNASTLIARSLEIDNIDKSIFDGFQEGNLKNSILKAHDNLHLIPAQVSFKNLPKFLYGKFSEEIDQVNYLNKLLDPIREDYDYIFIDVPPTISDFSDNAMMAADYVLIILQAQELSLEGAETYVKYLQFMVDEYDADIQVAGILPVLLRPGGRVDVSTLERAKETFGEDNVFNTVVKHLERLKSWDVTGIKNEDQHDRNAHNIFEKVVEELLEKLNTFEMEGKYD